MQRLPEFYNERVATLKQKTLELHEVAYNYTSGGEQKSNAEHSNWKQSTNKCDRQSPEKDEQVGFYSGL